MLRMQSYLHIPYWNIFRTFSDGKRRLWSLSRILCLSDCSFLSRARSHYLLSPSRHHNHVTFSGFLDMSSTNASAKQKIQLFVPLSNPIFYNTFLLPTSNLTLPQRLPASFLYWSQDFFEDCFWKPFQNFVSD